MTTQVTSSTKLLSLFALTGVVAILAAGCGVARSTGGSTKFRFDATTGNVDTGIPPLDSGIPPPYDGGVGLDGALGCGSNPNGCALNEVINPTNCACTNSCVMGYVYNFSSGQCDPIGTNPDGGTNPDSGGPPPMGCTSNAQCMGTNPTCMTFDTQGAFVFCAGQTDCTCWNTCTPNAGSGCDVGEGCYWIRDGVSVIDGVCIPDTGGGTQGQSCTATFNPDGSRATDSCSLAGNYICLGATAMNPPGLCAKFCPPSNPSVCTQLGNYTCDDLGDPTLGFGICLEPTPTFTDIGAACNLPTECMGNLCAADLGNYCSADCSGLKSCPTGSTCVSGTGIPPICALDCLTGGSGLCSSRNNNLSCWTLSMTLAICLPKCTSDMDCSPQTCNLTTGECQ